MALTITRATGDETAVKVQWSGTHIDLTDVTATDLRVYSDANGTTLVETLTGEKRGFDPATFYPIIDADWLGTRYWRIVLHRSAEEQPLATLHRWVQE